MQKITPHLWFDTEAVEVSEFYVSAFGGDSKITHKSTLENTPSGSVDMVSFRLAGHEFMAISAGPLFKFNPSISFILNFDPSTDTQAEQHLNTLWEKLSEGGTALMPIDAYPFSKRYGWIQDKYGLSWQLMLTNPEGEPRPFITPSLLFVKQKSGKAQEARDFYLSVFKNTKQGITAQFQEDTQFNQKKGDTMYCDFKIEDMWMSTMDGGDPHEFDFNEAISFLVKCESQEEIDYYWDKLSAVPEAEQCGWLKDKFGVSWQIVPTEMDEMMSSGDTEKIARVTEAFLKMKKFNLNELRKAAVDKM